MYIKGKMTSNGISAARFAMKYALKLHKGESTRESQHKMILKSKAKSTNNKTPVNRGTAAIAESDCPHYPFQVVVC